MAMQTSSRKAENLTRGRQFSLSIAKGEAHYTQNGSDKESKEDKFTIL